LRQRRIEHAKPVYFALSGSFNPKTAKEGKKWFIGVVGFKGIR
jgi:hypothetical protein